MDNKCVNCRYFRQGSIGPTKAEHVWGDCLKATEHAWGGEDKGYWDMPRTPLWPFGYGMSYTSYSYDTLVLESTSVSSSSPKITRRKTRLLILDRNALRGFVGSGWPSCRVLVSDTPFVPQNSC